MVPPRGVMRNLMTLLSLARYSSSSLSSPSSFITTTTTITSTIVNVHHHHHHHHHHHKSLSGFVYYYNFIAQIPMDKHSKDNEGAVKDQKREGHGKGDYDYNSSKRVSDTILPNILNLYGACATPRDFEIYAPDATFEDPLMRAHGVKQIKSAFYSLSKVFSESRIVEYNITENEISNGKQEILIDNKQHYKIFGKDIDMISLIKLYVEQGKVIRHEDWWDKKPLRNRETTSLPLVGRVLEITRRGSMMLTHAMMRCGKDPST